MAPELMDDLRRVYVQQRPGYKTRCGGCKTVMLPGESCQHIVIIDRSGDTEDEHMVRVNVARRHRVDVEGRHLTTS